MARSDQLKKGGFNIWAFLFTWLWYFVKGLWGKGLALLAGQWVLGWLLGTAIGAGLGFGAAASTKTGEEAFGALFGGSIVGSFIGGTIAWLIVGIYSGRSANGDLYIAVKQREKALAE